MNVRRSLVLVVGAVAGCSLAWPYDELRGGTSSTVDANAGDTPLGRPPSALCPEVGWCDLGPDTALQPRCPPKTTFDYPFHCRLIVQGESSAIADPAQNFLLLWGGGFDYAGNEVYTLDLGLPPRLLRRNAPGPIEACETTLSDGSPASRQTFDALVFLEAERLMYAFGGAVYCPTATRMDRSTWTLALADATKSDWRPTWTRRSASLPSDEGVLGAAADVEPTTGKVLLHTERSLWRYDLAVDRYERLLGEDEIYYEMTGRSDPKRRIFVLLGGAHDDAGRGGLRVYRSLPGGGYSVENRTDDARPTCGPLLDADAPGLAYDPVLDRFVGWPNQGGAVYILDVDTFRCTRLEYPNHAPILAPTDAKPTRGRFRYFPTLGVFIASPSDAVASAHALRLPGVVD